MALPVAEQVVYYVAVGGETPVRVPVDDSGAPWGRTQIGITEPGQAQMVFQVDQTGIVLVPPARVARFLFCVSGSRLA
jgi:hypothetical protein